MKNIFQQLSSVLRKTVCLSLVVQLSGLPVASAAVADISPAQLQSSIESRLNGLAAQSWSFMDEHQRPISASNLVADVLKNKQFYFITPVVSDEAIQTRLSVRVKLETPSAEQIAFKLAVMDATGQRALSQRRFTIDLDANKAQETKLRFERTMNSMTQEISKRSKELAKHNASDKIFAALSNFLVPSAHAAGMQNTSKMLTQVASGACTLGTLMLLFADLTQKAGGKTRLNVLGWLTVASFVAGGAAYVASGVVADIDLSKD